jgi:hypothetical protein
VRPSNQLGGVRLPPIRNISTALAVLIVIASVVWKVLGGLDIDLYLVPGEVWRGAVWQLVTWLPAAAPETSSVIFSALIVWMTGGQLEMSWGRARYLRFMVVTTLLAGLLTTLLALAIPMVGAVPFFGGNILSAIAWVGFGCAIWRGQTNIFGISMTGKTFALIGLGIACLNAVFSHPLLLVAEFFALALTFAYARFKLPGALFERFGSWRLERDLRKRSSHLKSIDGGKRNIDSGSDKYLH